MSKMDEIIIVVPRKRLFRSEKLHFQGTETQLKAVNKIFTNIELFKSSMRRGDAEANKEFKQPIPYAVIKRGNEIFVYERLSGAGETRLHNKLSLGVGGHMNPIEGNRSFQGILRENLVREINEEIEVNLDASKLQIIGLINDDEDEVGQVHIGILAILELPLEEEVSVRETDQLDGRFYSLDELKEPSTYERLENWSKIVVDIL